MQKQEKIIQMFDEIAPTYDKANRILSFGIDIKWRQKACERVLKCFDESGNLGFIETLKNVTHKKADKIKNEANSENKNLEKAGQGAKSQGLKIADIACGTGDMMMIWQEMATKLHKKIASITGVDPSANMLALAKEKMLAKKLENVDFIQAGAQDLPLKTNTFDILSIAYGIRNVVQRKEALNEFARVLKKEGILLVLEFAKSCNESLMDKINAFYLKFILPKIGGFISKNKAAYEYLPSSIDSFITKENFIKELENAGFDMMYYESFSFGIYSVFIAKKR